MDSSAFNRLGDCYAWLRWFFFAFVFFAVFGTWKLTELVYWAVTHVRVTW